MEFDYNKIFDVSTKLILFVLFFFLIVFIITLYWYTGPDELISALLSRETFFAVRLSLITATISTFFCMLISIPAAYALSRSDFMGKGIVDSLLNLPIVLPPVAVGAILLIFFTTPPGATIENVFIKFTYQVSGIVLAQLVIISALAIRVLKSAFDGLDPEYEQVARTLGYNKFRTFFKVTLPMCKKGILAAAVLAWARAVGEFGATVTLAGATRMRTETMPIAIFLNLAEANITQVTALILILIGIAIIVLYIAQRITGGYRVW